MVSRFKHFLSREIRGLHEAAFILGGFALLSQVLGFARDRAFATIFGAGTELDVYYAAFRVPDFLFVTLSSVVSVSVLVPFIVERMQRSKEDVRDFVSGIFSAFFITLCVASVAAYIAMPWLAENLFPVISSGPYGAELVSMARILLLSPFLLGLSNLFGSIVQAHQKFVVYALSPVLYNFGIIIGVLFLYPSLGLVGLAWGVVIGAMMHMLIQLPVLFMDGVVPRFGLNARWEEVRRVAAISIPRTISLGASQLAMIACVSIASAIAAGSVSVFTLSFNLQSVPMSIVGVSYSLAAFPVLAALYARGERVEFIRHLVTAARHIIFWSIPVAILFVVLRAQIVRTVLGAGAFSWEDTRLTAACLAFFAVSVVAQSLVLLFTRAYYCAGRTRWPLIVNSLSAGLIVVLAYFGVKEFALSTHVQDFVEALLKIRGVSGSAVAMVAGAYSVGMITNAVVLWISFEREYRGFSKTLWRPFSESLFGSLVMGYVAYGMLNLFADAFDQSRLIGVFLHGLLAGLTGLCAGIVALWGIGNAEIRDVAATLAGKLKGAFKRSAPLVDQTADEHVVS